MANDVTDTPIRYDQVFECLGCGCLEISPRADATTCSSKCRTYVHRHRDDFAVMFAWSKAQKISMALVQQCKAIQRLRPDLMPALRNGTLEIPETRRDVYLEFVKRLFAKVEYTAAGDV